MKNFDLNDMTNLLISYDAIGDIQDGLEIMCGARIIDGAIDRLMYMNEVIYQHSSFYDENEDTYWEQFYNILTDRTVTPQERAKILLGK